MIVNGKIRVLDLASTPSPKRLLLADANNELSTQVPAPIPLTDPPNPAYVALPSGSVFTAEFQIGDTIYRQLFIKP